MLPHQNLIATYQKADAMLASGELQQAADICKQMLEANPNFAYGYHLMASLFRTTGNVEKALGFADLAIKLDPNVPSFYLQRGELLGQLSCFDAAEEAFRKAYQLKPDLTQALLLMADACVKQGRYEQAVEIFSKARVSCPESDHADIDLHEGIYQLALGHMDQAEALFDRVITARPNQAVGYMQKAIILLHQDRDHEAEVCFARALASNPHLHEALHGMAAVNERQGQIDSAIAFAIQAVNANGSIFDSLLLLGRLLLRKQNWSAAEQIFRQALSVVPDHVLAITGFSESLNAQHKKHELRAYLTPLLAARPQHTLLGFFHAIATSQRVANAPADYVAGLYDELARRYDYFLQPLDMFKPRQLADMLRNLPVFKDKKGLSFLDLGCGSGRLAAEMQDVTDLRIGVDLSQRMLDIARMNYRYHDSYALDVTEFALGSDRMFDIVAALDVLPMMGSLEAFFRAARNVLASSSVLAFSIERDGSTKDWVLKPTGRFAHNPHYIQALLADHGYEVVHEEETLLRFEAGQPVVGLIYIIRKMMVH